jgi:hypothetical protein
MDINTPPVFFYISTFYKTLLKAPQAIGVIILLFTLFVYTPQIVNGQATVISTEPDDGATRVDPRIIINATFSEAMDESTINATTFTVVNDATGDPVNGTISYDAATNTTSFEPVPFDRDCDDCLNLGKTYMATLDASIENADGEPLGEDFTWTFQTGGAFTIRLGDIETGDLIAGSAFEITPDPFDLVGSLIVEDNGENDLDTVFFNETDPFDGEIVIFNAEFETYTLTEVTVPDGYEEIYENIIVTVHETSSQGSVTIENKLNTTSLDDIAPVTPPPPDLTADQFELYEDEATVAIFSGRVGDELGDETPINGVADQLPGSQIATPDTFDDFGTFRSVLFETSAPADSTAEDLFDLFDIPTYPNPKEEIADGIIYGVPAFVIPYEDENNNFIVTPIIGKVFPGMTLFVNQSSFVDSEIALVDSLNMTFAVEGNNVGFSFGITDDRPPGTRGFPPDVEALFLDIGFVGDVDFSDEDSFTSRPNIEILVNKTLEGFDELEDGCLDLNLFIFDEDDDEWVLVDEGRQPGIDTETQCGYTLQPEHFSKFGVGGIKGSTTTTESDRGGGGGGKRVVVVRNEPDQQTTYVETFPSSHFGEHPLDRIKVSNSGFMDADGNKVSQASAGHQISIGGKFTNHQRTSQTYSFIVMVIGEDGYAVDIAWQGGTIKSGQTADLSISWMPKDSGNYTVKMFVWDGFENASPLSNMTTSNISIV